MNNFCFIIRYLRGLKGKFLLVLVATVLFSFLTLFQNLIFTFVMDNLIQDLPIENIFLQWMVSLLGDVDYLRNHLYVVALFLISLYILGALCMYYRLHSQASVAESITKNLRDDLYRHLQFMPYAAHAFTKTGELIQRCSSDVEMIHRFFSGQIEECVATITSIIIALVTLFSIHPGLALFAGISFPLVFFSSYLFFRKIQSLFRESDEKEEAFSGYLQEALAGVRVIKAFNREKYELERFLKINGDYKEVTYKVIDSFGQYWSVSYLVCALGIFSVVLAGIFFVRNHWISAGEYFLFISFQSRILYQLRNFGRILSDFGKMSVSISRLQEIKAEKIEDVNAGEEVPIDGDIVYEHVSFHYENDQKMILKDINLTFPKGKTIAIIGPTGAGKSTLVHMLARLYEPSEGRIFIGGHDIRKIKKKHLRKNIGIVLQEPFLFSKTIYDNLHMVNPDSSENKIYRATRIAAIHQTITEFDKGYQTLVGERGVTLSGGQKQRIAIARTIINQTPILIFDDSLSAVDSETDVAIRNGLHAFHQDATMLIITQRVLSAKDADLIVVLENGEIAQQGTHQELIAKEGLYQRIYNIQLGIKKEENV